jgi:hypothetical protein
MVIFNYMVDSSNTPKPQKVPADTKADGATIGGALTNGMSNGFAAATKPAVTAVKNAGEAVVDTAQDGAAVASNANPKDWFGKTWKNIKDSIGGMSSEGGVGKIIGAILGLAGAWFAGNFFGEGIMGTILTIALAVPLSIIGSDKLGGMINGWLGNSQTPSVAQAPVPATTIARSAKLSAPEQTQAVSNNLPTANQTVSDLKPTLSDGKKLASQVWSNEELMAMGASGRVFLTQDANNNPVLLPVSNNAPDTAGMIATASLRDVQTQCSTRGQVAGIGFVKLDNGNYDPVCVAPRPTTLAAAQAPRLRG